jgi:hypothetical protein
MSNDVILSLVFLGVVAIGFWVATMMAIKRGWHVVPICFFSFNFLLTGYEFFVCLRIGLRQLYLS